MKPPGSMLKEDLHETTEQGKNASLSHCTVCVFKHYLMTKKEHQIYEHMNKESFFNSTFACIMRYKSNLSCNHERK